MSTTLIVFLIIFTLFWALILFLEKKGTTKKLGIERDAFVAVWKTKRFIDFLEKGGKRFRRFWKFYGNFGVVLGIIMMGAVFFLLTVQAYFAVTAPKTSGGVVLVIPGITIPLWYGLFALLVVLVVHEFSHGFLATSQDLKVKSVGLVLFAVIPGAFVEPDEEELLETTRRKRMRVFSVGSLANLLTGLIALLFISFLMSATVESNGMYISGVKQSGNTSMPEAGSVLYSVNGEKVTHFDALEQQLSQNDTYYTFETSEGVYTFCGEYTIEGKNVTIASENISVTFILTDMSNSLVVDLLMPIRPIYFYREPYYSTKSNVPSWIWIVIKQLAWIALLNIGIGLINLLPMLPLDGGALFRDIAQKVTNQERGKKIAVVMSFISLFIILLNFIPSFFGGVPSLK